jgi:hypothetical protein
MEDSHAAWRIVVERLLGQAGEGRAAADPELAEIAEQLNMNARKPGQLDIALTTLDRALELAEQTAKRLRQDVRGGLRQRIDRTLRRSEMRSDPIHLADELVARLQQHKVIASQGGH